MSRIDPGSTIGILGGGQLGRMLALAAAPLGYRCHVYCPDAYPPAGQVANAVTTAGYDDGKALERFAAAVDVVTYEFENVPADYAERLAERVPVRPGVTALSTAQDRLAEKTFCRRAGIPTAPFMPAADRGGLGAALEMIGVPAVLKTRRFGYDGKGQVLVRAAAELDAAWEAVAGMPCVLEGFVSFDMEISVIGARGLDGDIRTYPPVENRHVEHILDTSIAPAPIPDALAAEATEIARAMLEGLDYVGVLAVEMFVAGEQILVNEIAPRVHNSGHWSIEGAETSQFEQHVRAICGLPLGAVTLRGRAEMRNLIGEAVNDWPQILAEPGAHLHLYGKDETRPGRKMGHVTRVFSEKS
ncbi:MAG TPA: 5-(carboxyamino)imidazole ribonucleotide synthase [Alphaproteobacteria bacterium]|jgi:5-(carboxyamino)imidazole ribonucleotide synthase|nr:5-(carboxyamino)imidazole ribonucleotide synthase [Alphaproteobacteria bacterium]